MSRLKNSEIAAIIEDTIDYHERMRYTYFWTPPSSASSRRSYERYHTRERSFKYHGKVYEYESNCSCSCRNIYFSDGFYVDGEKKTVRAWKKVLAEINAKVGKTKQ